MSNERKTIVQSLVQEVWNGGNLAALEQFCAATIVRRQPPFPPVEGLAAYRDFLATTFATFANILHHPPYPVLEGLAAYRANLADTRAIWPDMKMIIEEMIVEGDTVVARGFWSGTQTGPLRWTNLPPTGKAVKAPACAVYHLQDGKVIEEFEYLDNLGMLRQLGLGAA